MRAGNNFRVVRTQKAAGSGRAKAHVYWAGRPRWRCAFPGTPSEQLTQWDTALAVSPITGCARVGFESLC